MRYWNIIYKFAWAALAVFFLIGLISIFWPQIARHKEYQRKEDELRDEIAFEEQTISQLKEKQKRFPVDPRFVEHIAHESGMVKSNEIIYSFVRDESVITAKSNENRR